VLAKPTAHSSPAASRVRTPAEIKALARKGI
jgi:hypothetical protein